MKRQPCTIDQLKGLADDFADGIDNALADISDDPDDWRYIAGRIAAKLRDRADEIQWPEPAEDHPALTAQDRNASEPTLKVLAVISAR